MELLTLIWTALLYGTACGEALNRFIKHYEPLDYDSESLMWNHHRVRRSMVGEREVELKFSAFGRDFDLVLKPETSLFHKDFTLLIDGQKASSQLAKYHYYSGIDRNDPSVRVHGHLAHDVFDGTIIAADDMYHIEPSGRYLRDVDHHSIIYRRSDLDLSTASGATCGSANEEIRKQMLQTQESLIQSAESARLRRQSGTPDPSRVRCWLYVIADYKFVTALSQTGENAMLTVMNIIQTASTIFQNTDFDNDGTDENIQFGIETLEIEESEPSGFFGQEFIGVEAFLNEHSTGNWSRYCLSYRFTSRDFDSGVVGLAYIAPQPGVNAAGGICENIQPFMGGVMKTLNTGIVTILNYNQRVPPLGSALTFAHEAGHNFGSNHDPRPDTPDPDGVYIMDAFSSDGSRENNRAFSLRSRLEMNGPVQERGQETAEGCFLRADVPCGNNLLDDGEECDCGPAINTSTGLCKEDPCCNGTSCTLATDVQCSPEQGPCCSPTCTFVDITANMTCSMETDCAMPQICNGSIATCPDPDPRENDPGVDYRLCRDGTALCTDNARCEGTFCLALGLDDCECPTVEQACHVCCLVGPDNGTCTSTLDIAAQNTSGLAGRLPGGMGAYKQVGFPCINFTGYCDFFNVCMIVDQDGALTRLANLIFNSAEFQLIIRWITTMWWAVILIVIGLIVILFVFVLLIHLCLPRPEKIKEKNKKKHETEMENIRRGGY